jgi:hypothetical protein
MQSTMYTMNAQGGLTPVDTQAFSDLQPGAVVEWGGNAAWGPTRYCILYRIENESGARFQLYNLDNPEKNAVLNSTESWNIKDENDPAVWHSQHYFIQPETIDPETVKRYQADHEAQRKAFTDKNDAAKLEADRLEALGRELWPSLIGECPAVIIAELEQDVSDSQTDYFASRTVGRVILAPSRHTRDLFPEMRKAAEILPETSHLGIGKGRFSPYVAISKNFISNGSCYYAGSGSPWHRELDKDENYRDFVFSTLAEAQAFTTQKGDPEPVSFDGEVIPFEWKIREEEIEHREKYSMGKGFYLGTSHYSGWQVSKHVFYKDGPRREDFITLAKRHDHLVKPSAPKSEPKPQPSPEAHAAADYTVTYERDWTWVKFSAKPTESVLSALKNAGARFSGKRVAWYFTSHVESFSF